jgi:hypothetical protein
MIELPHKTIATKGGLRDMDKVIELFKTPGFTAVLASLGAVLIAGILNTQIDKRRERQQFIRQILPERMKAYAAIIEDLAITLEVITFLIKHSPKDRINELTKCSRRFHTLYLRNMLWLESGVSDVCQAINYLLTSNLLTNDKIKSKEEISDEEYFILLTEYSQYFGLIQNRVKTGTGIRLLDKVLSEMTVKPKKNVSKKNNNPRRPKHS